MHCPHQTLLNRVSTQSDPFRLGDRERGGGEMGPFSPNNTIISAPLAKNATFHSPLPSSKCQSKLTGDSSSSQDRPTTVTTPTKSDRFL